MKRTQDWSKHVYHFHGVLNHNISAWSQYAIHLSDYIYGITSDKIQNSQVTIGKAKMKILI